MLPPKPEFQTDDRGEESPIDLSADEGRDSRNTERTGPSPDPAAFVRQASLGKKSKPTLTTVKSGERMKKEPMPAGLGSLPSQQQQQRAPVGGRSVDAVPGAEKDLWPPRVGPPARPSYEDDDDYRHGSYDRSAVPAGLNIAGSSNTHADDFLRKPSVRRRSSDVLSSGTGLMDPSESSDDSEKELERLQQQQMQSRQREAERDIHRVPSKELLSVSAALSKEQQHRPRSRSPLAPDVDPRVERIVGGLEKGGALTSEEAAQLKHSQASSLPSPGTGLSDAKDSTRRPRPPKLDVDKVRDAEARGSLTSLPDLIRRATKVASNLDRGKTASRLGMGFFENSSQSDVERMKVLERANRRSNNTDLSEMLASFPPPQGRNGEHGDMRRWSSNLRHEALPSTSDAGAEGGKKKGRRCCGMPLWLFLVLLVILLLLVAAAVVVPVVLVVLPNQERSLAKRCESRLSCQNGGVGIADAGVAGENTDDDGGGGGGDCRCLCISGYTGPTCGTYAPASCTTTSIAGRDDVTLGDAIPAVLASAPGFGLEIDGQRLLGLFAREDMGCATQNALVSFNVVQRRDFLEAPVHRRQYQTPTTTANSAAATSNGLLVAPSPTSTSLPTTSTSTPSSSPSSDSTSPDQSDRLSFASATVLYLFALTSSLDEATTAQSSLQAFFSGLSPGEGNASAIALGGGWSADLRGLELRSGNGTVVGGSEG